MACRAAVNGSVTMTSMSLMHGGWVEAGQKGERAQGSTLTQRPVAGRLQGTHLFFCHLGRVADVIGRVWGLSVGSCF